MKGKHFGFLLVATLAVILGALLVMRQESLNRPDQGRTLFPKLKTELNLIKKVLIETKEQTVTLVRQGIVWVVKEKHGYLADMGQIRSVLIGLAELTVMEPKTKNPELYGKLGLNDVKAKEHASTLVTVLDGEEQAKATIMIGNTRPAKGNSAKEEIYVRLPNNPQVLLTSGHIQLKTKPDEWIEKQVLNIDSQRVHSLRVIHPDGETISLQKGKPTDTDMLLQKVEKGRTIQSQFTLNNMADTVAHLTLDDIRPSTKEPLKPEGALKAILETFDGLRLTLLIKKEQGKQRATLESEFDKILVQPEETPEKPTKDEEKKADTKKTPSAEPVLAPKLKSSKEVKLEAEALNKHFQQWMFILPNFRVDAISKRVGDLTKPEQKS